ncbi:MAG: hypothetical protein ACREEA_11650 [Stellaceae bacterium]
MSSAQSPYGNTPLYFLADHPDERNGQAAWFQGMAWLLEHGADPNVPSLKSAGEPTTTPDRLGSRSWNGCINKSLQCASFPLLTPAASSTWP